MLRNDLINLLAQQDNDNVAVNVNGTLIDVDAVTVDRDNVVLVPYPEDMLDVLRQVASGTQPLSVKAD